MIKKWLTLNNIYFICFTVIFSCGLVWFLNNLAYFRENFDSIIKALLALTTIWIIASFVYFLTIVSRSQKEAARLHPLAKPKKDYLNVWKSLFYTESHK